MRKQMRLRLCWLCLLGLQIGFPGIIHGAEKVVIRLKPPEGQVARYKHTYSVDFSSDRAEVVSVRESKKGMVRVLLNGQWVSRETSGPVTPQADEEIAEGTVRVVAGIKKASSQASYKGEFLTHREYPHTLEILSRREFSWRVSPHSAAGHFRPGFRTYAISRPDVVADLGLLWMPELYPVVPEKAVGKGDTWTGEMSFEFPFAELGKKAFIGLTSNYEVKKIKVKKGRTIVQIKETREVRYRGWLYAGPVSVFMDGEGSGSGQWEIDVTRGIVISHKVRVGINRPEVMVAGQDGPVANIRAEFQWTFQRKLEKLEED